MELSGKIALVTGATGGIGSETARLLASQGAEVVVSGRDVGRGEATVQSILEGGGKARFVASDLANPDEVADLAEVAGAVDILINNAAAFPVAATLDQRADVFDAAIATNIRAPFFLTAALVPGMIARRSGSIVNVSTMAARIGMAGLSTYGATKAALESLTRTWAAEFGPSGIRVNAVAPGPTRTDMVLATMGEDGARQVANTTVLQRLANPREIAEVIVFVATDRASFITGATIAADAGRTAI